MALHLRAEKIPFEREFRFAHPRMWRFDFLLPGKLAVEIEGGVYSKGRHTRPKGFVGDCIKYNAAAVLGYRVLRYPTEMVKSLEAINQIKLILTTEGN